MFGEDSIPQFEINNFTLSVLENLASRNQEQNKHATIITKDHIQKSTEYAAEGRAKKLFLLYTVCMYFVFCFIANL